MNIGLVGSSGSGKSWYMQSLLRQVIEPAIAAGEYVEFLEENHIVIEDHGNQQPIFENPLGTMQILGNEDFNINRDENTIAQMLAECEQGENITDCIARLMSRNFNLKIVPNNAQFPRESHNLILWDFAGDDIFKMLEAGQYQRNGTDAFSLFQKVFGESDAILIFVDLFGGFNFDRDSEVDIDNFVQGIARQTRIPHLLISNNLYLEQLRKVALVIPKMDGLLNKNYRDFVQEVRSILGYGGFLRGNNVDFLNYFNLDDRNRPTGHNFNPNNLGTIWPLSLFDAQAPNINMHIENNDGVENFRIFPVSATGLQARGIQGYQGEWIPYRVFEPLIWVLELDNLGVE